jgi:hypothetical protein
MQGLSEGVSKQVGGPVGWPKEDDSQPNFFNLCKPQNQSGQRPLYYPVFSGSNE